MSEDRRIERVLEGLEALRRREPAPLSQGLSAANARTCLDLATRAITAEGLRRELAVSGRRPDHVAMICAWGVFTAPLEWAALVLAAGARLTVKPPSRDDRFLAAMVESFDQAGLPARLQPKRGVPGEAEALLAFGSTETLAEIRRTFGHLRLSLYGHRFSLALVARSAEPAALRAVAEALAWDLALYDGQGCMAPTAVFTTGDPEALSLALGDALDQMEDRLPRGPLPEELGPAWRQRVGLARARGRFQEGAAWATAVLPSALFTPLSLPRFAVVHEVPSVDDLEAALRPWRDSLSTLGTDLVAAEGTLPPDAPALLRWFPRVCPPGAMQTPPFPRAHDGRPMLGGLML